MQLECQECARLASKFPGYDAICADLRGVEKLHEMGVCRGKKVTDQRPANLKELTLQLVAEDRRNRL